MKEKGRMERTIERFLAPIEYTKMKCREVLVCKDKGIKTQYDPKTGTWKVGRPIGGKRGISLSVSGHGMHIFLTSARPPISFRPIKYGALVPEGMYFPPETVMHLIPMIDVATRVAVWLRKHPEYPKHSGCILPGSDFSQ